MVQLQARLKAALRLKDAQEQSDALNQQLREMNAALERDLTARDSDLIHARNTLVLALGRLVEQRDPEIGARLHRMRRYSRCLAEVAATLPSFAGQIDDHFVRMLECWAPLHDLGKVALPDHILHKPGKLDPDERIIMQSHTIIGAETLAEVARQDPSNAGFLQMAIDIARHHHECYDGTGYPDRLSGSAIPLPARLVTIADVYDALRCRRPYRPALSHAAAVQVMGLTARGQFDPALLHAFELIAPQFEQIFRDSPS
jgi:response regulator RpfG family c-di-GMP phosphodiesterase